MLLGKPRIEYTTPGLAGKGSYHVSDNIGFTGLARCGGVSSASAPPDFTFAPFRLGPQVILDGKLLGDSDGLFVVQPGPAAIAVELDGHRREKPVRSRSNLDEIASQLKLQTGRTPPPRDGSTRTVGKHRGGIADPTMLTVVVIVPPAVAGTPLSLQIQARPSYCARVWLDGGVDGRRPEDQRRGRGGGDSELDRRRKRLFQAQGAEQGLSRNCNSIPRGRRNVGQAADERTSTNGHQKTSEGDVTKTLNWLLQELAGPTIAYQYLNGDQTLARSKLDLELSPQKIWKLIRLTDGGGDKTLIFAADSGATLEAHWPFALRAPDLEELRQQFETTRDEILNEARKKTRSATSAERASENVIAMMVALEATYPPEVRVDPTSSSLHTSKRSCRALGPAFIVRRPPRICRPFPAGSGSWGQPGSPDATHATAPASNLLRPSPVEKASIGKLFQGMRILYMNIGAEKAETGGRSDRH